MKYFSFIANSTLGAAFALAACGLWGATGVTDEKASHTHDEVRIIVKFERKNSVYLCHHDGAINMCTFQSSEGENKGARLNAENFAYLLEKAGTLPTPSSAVVAPPSACPKRYAVVSLKNGASEKYWTACLEAATPLNKAIASLRELIWDLF